MVVDDKLVVSEGKKPDKIEKYFELIIERVAEKPFNCEKLLWLPFT